MKRRGLLAAGAAGLTGLAGCLDALGLGGAPPVEAVEGRIIDLRRPSAGATSATLPIVFEFENTGDGEVPAPVVEYDVYVEGTEIGGTGVRLTNLDPGESETAIGRATVEYADVAKSVVDAVRARQFTVRVEGTIESEGASTSSTDEYSYSA